MSDAMPATPAHFRKQMKRFADMCQNYYRETSRAETLHKGPRSFSAKARHQGSEEKYARRQHCD